MERSMKEGSDGASEYRVLLHPRPSEPDCPSRSFYRSIPLTNHSHTGESSPSLPGRKGWPWSFWLLLKILGLYNYRRTVTRRRCHLCRLAVLQRSYRERGDVEKAAAWLYPGAVAEQVDDAEAESPQEVPMICVMEADSNPAKDGREDVETSGGCKVCRSMWWDSEGLCRPYTKEDIGVRGWNHRGSTVLSIMWSLILFAFTLYEMSLKIKYLGGRSRELVPFISYSTHIFFNMSTPSLVLMANVWHLSMDRRRLRRVHHGFRWWKALSIRYIVRRVQHLQMGQLQLPRRGFLMVCLGWPLFNGVFSFFLYTMRHHTLWQERLSLIFSVVCMIVWGAFCYLVLLLRLALHQQQRLELAFLWKHAGDLDVCRRKLAMFAEDLGSMRLLVTIWIILVASVSSWAFSSLLYWEYLAISGAGGVKVKHGYFMAFNVNIWSTNTMFLALPLFAVGGVDLKGMWSELKRNISQMRSESQDAFWDKILHFCEEQSPVTRVKMLTLMFSALGLFLGLHLSMENQDVYMPIQETNIGALTTPGSPSNFSHF